MKRAPQSIRLPGGMVVPAEHFDEEKHPREKDGKWTEGQGGGAPGKGKEEKKGFFAKVKEGAKRFFDSAKEYDEKMRNPPKRYMPGAGRSKADIARAGHEHATHHGDHDQSSHGNRGGGGGGRTAKEKSGDKLAGYSAMERKAIRTGKVPAGYEWYHFQSGGDKPNLPTKTLVKSVQGPKLSPKQQQESQERLRDLLRMGKRFHI